MNGENTGRRACIIMIIFFIATILFTIVAGLIMRFHNYKILEKGIQLEEACDYIGAYELYESIGNFIPAEERIELIEPRMKFELGIEAYDEGRYLEAIELLIPIAKSENIDGTLQMAMEKYLEERNPQ